MHTQLGSAETELACRQAGEIFWLLQKLRRLLAVRVGTPTRSQERCSTREAAYKQETDLLHSIFPKHKHF